jgi:hypothetical protein
VARRLHGGDECLILVDDPAAREFRGLVVFCIVDLAAWCIGHDSSLPWCVDRRSVEATPCADRARSFDAGVQPFKALRSRDLRNVFKRLPAMVASQQNHAISETVIAAQSTRYAMVIVDSSWREIGSATALTDATATTPRLQPRLV